MKLAKDTRLLHLSYLSSWQRSLRFYCKTFPSRVGRTSTDFLAINFRVKSSETFG